MVTRYDLDCSEYESVMSPHPHGDYVDYHDYEELFDKYKELCEKIEDLSRGI